MSEERKIEGMKVVFSEEEIAEIKENVGAVLRSGHLIKGLFSDPFAKAIANRCGKERAVLCSSDTAAMEMLFRALHVDSGGVVFQGNMFPSPIFACRRAGGRPLYADLELEYLGMEPDSLEQILNVYQGVKAVVVMHTAGIISPKIVEIADLCRKRNVVLIEDCAHAYGSYLPKVVEGTGIKALVKGIGAGSWGDFAVLSFYATKPMNCGEGGAIAADERWFKVLDEVEMLSRYGKAELFGPPRCELSGYSNRMTEILCAVGVVEDRYLPGKILKRLMIADAYNSELHIDAKVYGKLPGQNFYKYVIYPNTPVVRETFKNTMKHEFGIGIPAGVYDFPVYDQPPLKVTRRWTLGKTESFCRDHICLPMHEGLSAEDVMFVARAVNEVLGG
jgi:dTDP-4-amino-4,6-dideoxygalactose transaminase